MKNKLNRIKTRTKIITNAFKVDLVNFSPKITFVNLLKNIACFGGPIKKLNRWLTDKRDGQIFDYLYNTNKEVFDKYQKVNFAGEETDEKIIWVCWFQGEEFAPPLVKKCIDSIRKNAGECKVIVIDINNYKDYVTLNEVIVRKFLSKKISPAHFSDVLRVNLIRKYGGLWLDATIFCTQKIPDEVYDYSFFTCKSPRVSKKECGYISEFQWTTFVLGGKKNSCYYSFMCDYYDAYWQKNNAAIDYLFADYVIQLACDKIPYISQLKNQVPVNNLLRDELQRIFDEPYNHEKFSELISGDTYLFKLSWRMDFSTKTTDGQDTYFGKFISDYCEVE